MLLFILGGIVMKFINSKSYFLNPNHIVIEDRDVVTFYSYESFIGYYDKQDDTLHLNSSMWDYSNTTRKYFKAFINDFTSFTYDNKAKFVSLIESMDNIIVYQNGVAV